MVEEADNDNIAEAAAYTPGLKVKQQMTVRKTRQLPIDGDVLVNIGDTVNFNTIVSRGSVHGDPVSIDASTILGVEDEDLPLYIVKKIGDQIKKDEVVAQYIAYFGLVKNFVRSPIDGTFESVSDVTGNIVLRANPVAVEIDAYIPGKVVELLPRRGAVIETCAAYINGIFGIGGERHGKITIAADSPDKILTPDIIASANKTDIVVGGSFAPTETIRKAIEVGVRGIVVGGVDQRDLVDILGQELGVAITGQEEIGVTLIITEGFGKMTMSQRTFNLLKEFNGYNASINGATQIRAGVLRPEIIIPQEPVHVEEETSDKGLVPGTPVRIIRAPFFGKIGTIVSLPPELQEVQTRSKVRVAIVEIDKGERVMVPRANVEIIEE